MAVLDEINGARRLTLLPELSARFVTKAATFQSGYIDNQFTDRSRFGDKAGDHSEE